MMEKNLHETIAARLWSKVDKSNESGCWEWMASVDSKGYGQINVHGKIKRAHRLAYELIYGNLKKTEYVCHKCDNRKCVNPNHMFVGSAMDNMQDMILKDRARHNANKKGEDNPKSKLSVEDVKYIKSHPEIKGTDLAKKLGVLPTTICEIRKNRSWKHV